MRSRSRKLRLGVLLPMIFLGLGTIRSAWCQPETLQQARQQQIETIRQKYAEIVRGRLKLTGVTDTAAQDAVVEFDGQQRQFTETLLAQARLLARRIASKSSSDAQIAALYKELRAGIETEKERRALQMAALKTQTAYDQNPRLETMLMFFGLIGDESSVLDALPQALQRLGVESLPEGLKKLGINDEENATTILQFAAEQEKELAPLLAQAYQNQFNEIRQLAPITDESRRAFLAQLRSGVTKYQNRRSNALGRLDAKLNYTRKPRLEAALFLLGITSDDAALLNGFNPRGTLGFKRYSDPITGEKTPG